MCQVVRIIEPTAEEIAQYERDMADSDDEASADPLGGLGTQGSAEKPITLDDDDDIQIISESPAKTPKPATPIKKQPDNSKKENYPPYATYKYEVEEEQAWDYKTCKVRKKELVVTFLIIKRASCHISYNKES